MCVYPCSDNWMAGLVCSAGVFSSPVALELYTEVFEKSGASVEQVHDDWV